ncbi:MAG: hypothetical protein U5J99_11425 [Parvularculaceae bacterium]|nr:hypothetical protein [Parvularculaceae bacterium]
MARSGRLKEELPARRATVRIETIGAQGDGVGRTQDGETVFAPLTAPGDIAIMELRGERARLLEFVEKSAVRADPPCRHFGECGGCALQHVTALEQARWKAAQVIEALDRERITAERVNPVLTMPAASRRRAVFAARRENGALRFGFNVRRSGRVIAIADCKVLAPALAARLDALRALAASVSLPEFDVAAIACENGLDVNLIAAKLTPQVMLEQRNLASRLWESGIARLSINGEPVMTLSSPIVSFGGVAVTPPPGAFLQASHEGEAALLALVKSATAGARKIADLFSGCGAFALPLARAASVSAFDSDRPAIEALKRAAAIAQGGASALNPVRADLRDLFERPLSVKELKPFDAVIFDPPRAGSGAQAAEIAKSGVPHVVGVSCNPQTFARDASLLVAGGYRLLEVTPVDQFVYSPHIELAGVFTKR